MFLTNGFEKIFGVGRHNSDNKIRPSSRGDEMGEKKPLLSSGKNSAFDERHVNLKQIVGLRRSVFLFSLYVVFYGVFLVAGGLVFAMLEGPGEEKLKLSLIRARSQFLEDHPCVKDEDLENLILKIVSASNRGVSAVGNVSGESNWSFGQSLFFTTTVVTTIGYGHVTPLSRTGKYFCIVYAILGIPLTLVLVTAVVDKLMVPSRKFLRFLHSKLGHRLDPLNLRILHLLAVGSLLFAFFWFLPAALFSYLEPDWDFLDSMYYCFISLTTIGLGDYIPGDSPNQNHRPLYKVLTTGYLLSGLAFLTFTLNVFHEIPQLNFGTLFRTESDQTDSRPSLSSSSSSSSSSEKTRLGRKHDEEAESTRLTVEKARRAEP